MNRLLTRRNVVILAIIMLVVLLTIATWFILTRQDKYAVVEEQAPTVDKVAVDFSKHEELFTPAQRLEIEENMRSRTTKKIPENTPFTGTIRESSVQQVSKNEVSLIIDSEELQTSYLISRFVNPENNLDILNIVCVDESKKIYERDYCLVE